MNRILTVTVSLAIILISAIVSISIVSCGRQEEENIAATTSSAVAETTLQKYETETPPVSVSVGTPMLTLGVGESVALQAQYDGARPASGAQYTCDRPNVLSVNAETGSVTAEAAGWSIVKVTSPNGLTADCYVTVKKAPEQVRFDNKSVTQCR